MDTLEVTEMFKFLISYIMRKPDYNEEAIARIEKWFFTICFQGKNSISTKPDILCEVNIILKTIIENSIKISDAVKHT